MAISTNSPTKNASSKAKGLIGIGVVGLVAILGVAYWLGFLTPEPDPVSITEAAAAVTEEAASETEDDSAEAEAASGEEDDAAVDTDSEAADTTSVSLSSIAGEWTIAESDATFIGYRADGTTGEGVGRSSGVTGTLTASETEINAVSIVGDMTMLESDSSVRDEHLGDEGLETNVYPTATFELTEPIAISEIPDAGVETTFTAVGELTVKEIAQPVTIELQALIIEDKFVVAGSTEIALADFDAVISSTTEATMEFSVVFEQ